MFTGLITDIGTIKSIKKDVDMTISVCTNYNINEINLGDSIACNGVCLTVIKINQNNKLFYMQLSKETLDKSNFDNIELEQKINLEKALKVGDELGGHIVSGHVDLTANIAEIKKISDCYKVKFAINKDYAKYIVQKGSVTIDGVSLTVNDVVDNYFYVNIIPFTFDNTIFKYYKEGDIVNIEIDMLARYVEKMLNYK